MSDFGWQDEQEVIFHNTQDALFLIETDGEEFRFKRLNATHEQLTGLKTEKVRGKTPVEILGREPGEQVEEKYRQCYRAGKTISYQEVLQLPAGEKVWETILTPVFAGKRIKGIVGSSRDVTEQKKMEDRLKNSQSALRSGHKGCRSGNMGMGLK